VRLRPLFNLNFVKVRDYQTYQAIDWRSVAFVLVLVSGLSLFYTQTQSVDTDKHKKIVQSLLELRQFSAQVNEQVLFAQRHGFHNYDLLSKSSKVLMPLLQEVRLNLPQGANEKLNAEVVELNGLLEQQAEILEVFKSRNALLKNSLNFLPTIANKVLSDLQASRLPNPQLMSGVNQLFRETLSYNLTSDLKLVPKLQGLLTQFNNQYRHSALRNNRDLRRFLAHVQIILGTRQQVDELSNALLSLPIIADSIKMEKIYLNQYDHAFAGVETARFVMYVFSLVLLLYIMFLFSRMHLQSTELKQSLTEQKLTEEALFLEKEIAQFTLQSIGGGVIRTNLMGLIDFMNPIAEKLTGINRHDALGKQLETVFSLVDESSGDYLTNLVHESLEKDGTLNYFDNYSLFSKDGYNYPIRLTVEPIRDRAIRQLGVVLVFHDVGEERRLRQRLIHQANHDDLTGLINRREFERRLDEAIQQADSSQQIHSLLFLDLDQFKIVNDTCGHIAGDTLLKMLAQKLQIQLGGEDTLSRLGGDEFGILLLNSDVQESLAIANLLQQMIAKFVFEWDGQTHQVGVSIGLNVIDSNSVGLYEVMSGADVACYAAKEQGRNRVRVYEADNIETSRYQNEMKWVARTRKSISDGHLVLYCQAIEPANVKAGLKTHFEVLLRMMGESGEIIGPDDFMRSAERYGIMPEIDRWVVENVFKEYQRCFGDTDEEDAPELAINLSGTSFNEPDFCRFIVSMFELYNVPGTNICFEVTETAAIVNLVQAKDFINQFSAMGCKFSLDDFGTGLSSFGYLKNLSVDYLKIDGGFVKDLMTDSIDQATVSAINQVGHSLGMLTIAEWVENADIQLRLQEMGVDYLQGYHLHRPEPIAQVFSRRFAV